MVLTFEVKEYSLVIHAVTSDDRHATCIEMIKDAIEFYKPKDVPLTHIETGDFYNGEEDPRTFCFSTSSENFKNLIPDSYSKKWIDVGIPDVAQKCKDIRDAGEKKYTIDKAFWIGVTRTHATRSKLIEISRGYPELIDAREMSWNGHMVVADKIPEFVSLEQHAEFRHLIDVQGVGWSGRLKYLLFSGRPILVADRKWWDWATCDLLPWVHYIPVAENLDDLVDKIRWARENTDECERIASRGKDFIVDRMGRVNEGMQKIFL